MVARFKEALAIAVAAISLASALAVSLLWFHVPRPTAATAAAPAWHELTWPFPVDPWGKGKAFRCKASDCGVEVTLYLRAKIGLCNCATGVADDDDLDRMGDTVLLGDVSPIGPGHPVSISRMNGRSRTYKMNSRGLPGKTILSVVYNERCDMIAATAVLGHDPPATIEPRVIEFLSSSTAMSWAEVTLGL
jgi:hypothetical protein